MPAPHEADRDTEGLSPEEQLRRSQIRQLFADSDIPTHYTFQQLGQHEEAHGTISRLLHEAESGTIGTLLAKVRRRTPLATAGAAEHLPFIAGSLHEQLVRAANKLPEDSPEQQKLEAALAALEDITANEHLDTLIRDAIDTSLRPHRARLERWGATLKTYTGVRLIQKGASLTGKTAKAAWEKSANARAAALQGATAAGAVADNAWEDEIKELKRKLKLKTQGKTVGTIKPEEKAAILTASIPLAKNAARTISTLHTQIAQTPYPQHIPAQIADIITEQASTLEGLSSTDATFFPHALAALDAFQSANTTLKNHLTRARTKVERKREEQQRIIDAGRTHGNESATDDSTHLSDAATHASTIAQAIRDWHTSAQSVTPPELQHTLLVTTTYADTLAAPPDSTAPHSFFTQNQNAIDAFQITATSLQTRLTADHAELKDAISDLNRDINQITGTINALKLQGKRGISAAKAQEALLAEKQAELHSKRTEERNISSALQTQAALLNLIQRKENAFQEQQRAHNSLGAAQKARAAAEQAKQDIMPLEEESEALENLIESCTTAHTQSEKQESKLKEQEEKLKKPELNEPTKEMIEAAIALAETELSDLKKDASSAEKWTPLGAFKHSAIFLKDRWFLPKDSEGAIQVGKAIRNSALTAAGFAGLSLFGITGIVIVPAIGAALWHYKGDISAALNKKII